MKTRGIITLALLSLASPLFGLEEFRSISTEQRYVFFPPTKLTAISIEDLLKYLEIEYNHNFDWRKGDPDIHQIRLISSALPPEVKNRKIDIEYKDMGIIQIAKYLEANYGIRWKVGDDLYSLVFSVSANPQK